MNEQKKECELVNCETSANTNVITIEEPSATNTAGVINATN